MNTMLNKPTLLPTWLLPDTTGLGGAVAGFVTGALTLLLWPLAALIAGADTWNLPQTLATSLFDATGSTGSTLGLTAAAALLWVGTAVVLGGAFGVVYRRVLKLTTDFGMPLYVGLVYGLLLFLGGTFVALPLLGLGGALTEGMGVLMAQCVVFGTLLGLVYTAVRPAPYRTTLPEPLT